MGAKPLPNVIIEFESLYNGNWLRSSNLGTQAVYTAAKAFRIIKAQPDRDGFAYRAVRLGPRGGRTVIRVFPVVKP